MTRPRRLTSAILAVGIAALALSGCGSEPGCDLVQPAGPLLRIDLSGWFAEHPGSTLDVCFDGHCEDWPLARIAIASPAPAATEYRSVIIEGTSSANRSKPRYQVTVTSMAGAALPGGHVSLDVTTRTQSNACGSSTRLATATLNRAGHLSATTR